MWPLFCAILDHCLNICWYRLPFSFSLYNTKTYTEYLVLRAKIFDIPLKLNFLSKNYEWLKGIATHPSAKLLKYFTFAPFATCCGPHQTKTNDNRQQTSERRASRKHGLLWRVADVLDSGSCRKMVTVPFPGP